MSIGGALMVQRALREVKRALPRPRGRRGGSRPSRPRRILATRLISRRTRSARLRDEAWARSIGLAFLLPLFVGGGVILAVLWFGAI